jgi:hypothetical protein
VIRKREDLDALVTELVVARLSAPDAAEVLTTGTDNPERAAAVAEADQLRARLDEVADQYADGLIDGRMLERITARLRPQLAEADARSRVVDFTPLLDGLAGAPDVRVDWEGLSLSRRRAVVDTLMTITLNRTRQGARTFDPEAVRIDWK